MKKKVVLVAIFIFTLWLIFSVSRQVYSLFKAGKRVSSAEQTLTQLEQEKEKLQKELAYRESNEFIEKEARDRLGLAKEGETIAILPKKLQDQSQSKTPEQSQTSNFSRWFQRLFSNP
jgi:cell division protein FtsB